MATRGYKRLHGLTLEQHNAIDRLALGQTDLTVAGETGVNRVTITRWRLYDPLFQAALNRRRAELWRGSVDGARGLLPTALDTLFDQLTASDHRGRLALDLLRLAGVFTTSGGLAQALVGPQDPDAVLDAEAHRRRLPLFGAAPSTEDPQTTPDPNTPITPDERDAVLAAWEAELSPDLS